MTYTTLETLTLQQILDLETECGRHGDLAGVEVCRIARNQGGKQGAAWRLAAQRRVVGIINDREAQETV